MFAKARETGLSLESITFWLMGSFEQSTMADVYVLLPIVMICSIVVLSIGWRVNIIALGREEAQTKGINYDCKIGKYNNLFNLFEYAIIRLRVV